MMSEVGAGRRQPVTARDEIRSPSATSAPPWRRSRESQQRNARQTAAQQAALTALQRRHPAEYAKIYQEELDKLGVGDKLPIGRYSKRDRAKNS